MLKNVIANMIGRFWGILSNFLFIPLYIKFLGIESYSVISFSLVIAGLMAILDGGLTATLSREFALKTNDENEKKRIFSTLESCYFIISLVIIILTFLLSDQIATSWLNLESINSEEVSYYIKILGIGISFQFLGNFYSGGFLGLELQVKSNIYQVIFGIFRNAIVILPLIFYPTLEVFFLWQTLATVFYTIFLRFTLKKILNVNYSLRDSLKIEREVLSRIWKFAGGMVLISIVAAVNTQLDKLVISKVLPITQLGYYVLAVTIAQGILLLVNPISTALLPRFTMLFSEHNTKQVNLLFRQAFLFISILVFSIATIIIFNSENIIWIWTSDSNLVLGANQFVIYLTIGMLMLALQILPFIITIANGYTKINNYLGIVSLLFTLPSYWFMTKQFGGIGAAITWCVVQSIIAPFYFFLVHRRFLVGIPITTLVTNGIFKPLLLIVPLTYFLSEISLFQTARLGLLFSILLTTVVTISTSIIILIPTNELKQYLSSAVSLIKRTT